MKTTKTTGVYEAIKAFENPETHFIELPVLGETAKDKKKYKGIISYVINKENAEAETKAFKTHTRKENGKETVVISRYCANNDVYGYLRGAMQKCNTGEIVAVKEGHAKYVSAYSVKLGKRFAKQANGIWKCVGGANEV